jgi:hypothetical protein
VGRYRRLLVSSSAQRLRLPHDYLAHGTRLEKERDDTVTTKHQTLPDAFANCFGSRPQSPSTTVTQHSSDPLLTAKDCNSGDTVQSLAGLRHDSEGPNVTSGRNDYGADIAPTATTESQSVFSMRSAAAFPFSRTVGALNAIIRLSSDIDSYRAVSPSRMSEDKTREPEIYSGSYNVAHNDAAKWMLCNMTADVFLL